MVNETRQVVEDYVLYKIHSLNNNGKCFSNKLHSLNNQDFEKTIKSKILLSLQDKPSNLNLAVRSMAKQIEDKYQEIRPDLFEEIRNVDMTNCDVKKMLFHISKILFPLPIKPILYQTNNCKNTDKNNSIQWGHVIAFLVYAGLLAVRAVECKSFNTVDEILTQVTTFFNTQLSDWLASKGGWTNFYEWSKGSVGRLDCADSQSCGSCASSGFQAAMRVGVVAACVGIGALIISKK